MINKAKLFSAENPNSEHSPLFVCSKTGFLEAFKSLYVEGGHDLDLNNHKTSTGFTALTYAAYNR